MSLYLYFSLLLDLEVTKMYVCVLLFVCDSKKHYFLESSNVLVAK